MNFIQRAIKNVTRRKSKSILLILTFFLIGNLVIVGLGISTASKSAKTLTRQKMRAVVSYEIDYDAVWRYADSIEDQDEQNEFYEKYYPRIKIDEVKELLKDDRVKTANAISTNMVYPVDDSLSYVHLNNEAEANIGDDGRMRWDNGDGSYSYSNYVEPMFSIRSNYFPDMIELVDGDYTITEGSFYTQEDIDNGNKVCLVTNALAENNGLKIGDTIKFAITNASEIENSELSGRLTIDDATIEAEIIGIYENSFKITPDSDQFNWTYPYENPDNMILMPSTVYDSMATTFYNEYYKYLSEINGTDYGTYETYISNVTLLLNDPLDVDQFVEDYKGNLAEFKKLNANNEEFNNLAKPLDTLSLYAKFIVTLVIINAVVIITLVTALTLKTREYEIGVLLSIGATKLKVIAQFFIELALVAIVGFTLAVGTGSLIAKNVGAKVLEYQISASGLNQEEDEYYGYDYVSIWNTDYSTDVSLDDLLSEYEVSVSPTIIGEIYVVGLSIVLVSVIIPSFMIMRYNPKKILMNQG